MLTGLGGCVYLFIWHRQHNINTVTYDLYCVEWDVKP